MDIRVKLNTGETVDVEIQSFLKKGFLRRILFYWSRLYTEDLHRGEDYNNLRPTYCLVFTDFDVFKKEWFKKGLKSEIPCGEDRSFINSFSVRLDKAPYFALSHDLRIVFVELSRFHKENPSVLTDMIDLRDLWCYTLKESGRIGMREWAELSCKGEEMKKAMDHLRYLSEDEELRAEEEARERFLRDQRAEKAYAFDEGMEKGIKQGIEQGMEQGMEKGMEKGIKQGIEKGIEKGMEKGMEKLILNMLKNGASVDFISKYSGWSEEKIKQLQK